MSEPTVPFANLTGKTAVVTGASSGIGRAIAWEFARAGANVAVHYARSADAANELVAEIESIGRRALAFQSDFFDASAVQFCERVWNGFGPVDIWVNNAGVDLLTGEGKELGYEEKLKRLLDVDVKATVLIGRAIGALMQQRGSGVILNVGWDQADRGMEGDSGELFATAKNAVMGFTRSLAVSLAPQVRVNCIAPGWILTAWGEQAGAPWHERVMSETPLKRWGRPEDIASLARFLASDEAGYCTGQVINFNGGAIR